VQTPGVHILGHPRGRMYGSRPGVTADWEKVFTAAARSGVAIELDGDPSRQDLDFDLARLAVLSGCLFAIDSDAHDTDQWWYAETALAHARIAGIPTSRVINCWTLSQLMDWLSSHSRARQARSFRTP
jgi:histidinol phosphatase-like PHP family hydrolase